MLEYGPVFAASFLAAVVLTPLVRAAAIRLDIVDHPDSQRKLHGRTVARAGGSAVLWAVLLVCAGGLLQFDLSKLGMENYAPYLALVTAMVGMWLLGLADDIWTLRGRQKLVGQVVLTGILVSAGFEIRHLQLFGQSLDLGMLSIPASMVWLLATTNALNLIDGSDGLCATLGAIICGALGILASANGHLAEATIAFALCGALAGFLVFNFPPASIFLGDSGSLLIGMVAGALAIRCSLKGPATVAFLAPLCILSLPLLDSVMAIIRRKLTGRSIYTTDRAHLHHTLKNRGLSDRGLLLVVALLAVITGGGALAGQALGRDWIAPISVIAVFSILVVTRAFGYAEMVLIARRSSHFAFSLIEPARKSGPQCREKAIHLQGTRQWQTVWQTLVEFAEREQLNKVHMDLNVPWLEEGFHGTWHRHGKTDRHENWSTSLPIQASGRVAGRVDVEGLSNPTTSKLTIYKLLELIEDLAPQVELLLEPEAHTASVASVRDMATTESAAIDVQQESREEKPRDKQPAKDEALEPDLSTVS